MKVWVTMDGSNLAPSYVEDAEEFQSLYRAVRTFEYRASGRDSQFPGGMGEDANMRVWVSDPRERSDEYPDYLYVIGPRGGVKRESI